MPGAKRILKDGAIAGFLAGTTVVLFFFVIDLIAGQPLRTPTFLAGVLFRGEAAAVGAGLIALYTLLHYGAFMLVGIAVGWLVSRLTMVPGLLLGIVLGFLLFDLIFYASVLITGVNVVDALGWPEVLVGNLLAGIVLMAYFHLRGPVRALTWWEMLRHHRILREGLAGGLLAAGAVAVWFLVFDALYRRILFTPAALGSALFLGANSPAEVQVTVGTVLGYTAVHVAAFVLVGWTAAAIAVKAETNPPLVLVFIEAFVTLEALFIGHLAIFAEWILDTLGWWNVAVGNLIAAIVLGVYFWHEHPGVPRSLREKHLDRPT